MVANPRPIRVLRAITRLNIGGPAIHAILLTRDLDDGVAFTSTLVSGTTAPHEGDMLDLAAKSGVAPVMLGSLGREVSPMDDLVSLATMVKLVRQHKPDVVHTHMAKAGTVGRLAARICGVPLIVHTYHGHVFHSYFGPLRTRVFVTIERALGMATNRIIVLGEGQRDEIAGFGVAPREKLVPIRLGLELSAFVHSEQHRGELRGELDIPRETRLVGIAGRLVPIKAHEVFFAAAARVKAAEANVHFVVIGDGERRQELDSLVSEMGLQSSVTWLGWRRDMPRVYADMDVVALTSRNEGSPVVLIEALAAGRPVLSTHVGGVPDVVIDGETGLTVPSGDVEAVADAMLRLLRDGNLAARLGAAGRRHVYPRYDSSRLVDDVRNLYLRELIARGRPVPSVGLPA